ncbi:MAG TPA: heavy-metal-associated domain-containing protein [Chitinophagaceae bacterium]
MKRLLSMAVSAFAGTPSAPAVSGTTASFKVYGNCGMCRKRIQKAAESAGATEADWNSQTKIITVTFDDAATNLQLIHDAIAAAGHDTEQATAPDAVYSRLHSCCRYERRKH